MRAVLVKPFGLMMTMVRCFVFAVFGMAKPKRGSSEKKSKNLQRNGQSLNEMAVLVRTGAMTREFEERFSNTRDTLPGRWWRKVL